MKCIIGLFLIMFVFNIGYGQAEIPADVQQRLDQYLCTTCHKLNEKLIGPSFTELANKGNSIKELAKLIVEPNPSNWPGYPPMAPMPHIDKSEINKIAKWIKSLETSD